MCSCDLEMEGNLTKTQFWLLVFCAYACMVGQGFIDNVRSVTYPMMKKDINLSYSQFGSLQSMAQFSYLLWSLAVAMSLQKLGFKLVILLAFIISMVGCFLTSTASNFWTLFLYQLLACAGMGGLDDAPHALSSILFTSNTGILMLLLHSCYGLGAIIGPIFAGAVNKWFPQYSFRGITIGMTIPLALLALIVACVPFAIKKPKTEEQEKTHSGHTVGSALMSPMVWFQALILVIMTTGERATSAWGGMYLKDVLHLDPAKEGAWFNSCFYLAFTLARLVGGFLVDSIGAFATEYLVMIGSIIIFTVGLVIGKTGVYVLPFAGAFVAFFWPTFIVTCMRYWKEDAAVPISCILPMQASLGIPIQYVLGVLNDKFGPRVAYSATVPMIVVALILLVIYHMILRKKEAKEKEALLTNAEQPVEVSVNCVVCLQDSFIGDSPSVHS